MAAISGLLFVLSLETMVRLAGLDVPRVWEPDRELGWHHIPGATRHFTEEGDGWISINSLGFRDRERSLEKKPGTFRIMVLGDSMTEAAQVNPDQNFCYLLEKQWNAQGRPVEVLNCGVNGYSPTQELLLLRREGPRYRPDFIVLGLFLDNDVSGCHPLLNTTAEQSPSAKLDGQTLVFDFSRPEQSYASYHREPIYSIRKWSATYRWFRAGSERRNAEGAGGRGGVGSGIPKRHMLYAIPSPPEWEDAWAVMEQTLLDLSEEAARQGAKLLIVSLPCSQVADPIAWQDVLKRRPDMQGKSWDLEGPDRRLQAFAEKHQLLLYQPLEAFKTCVKDEPLFIGNVGHMNAHGHQVTADLVAEFLEKQQLLPEEQRATPADH